MDLRQIFRHYNKDNRIEYLTMLTIIGSNLMSSTLTLLFFNMNRNLAVLIAQLSNVLISALFVYAIYRNGLKKRLICVAMGFYYFMAVGMWFSLSFAHHMAMSYYMNIVMCTIILLKGRCRTNAVTVQAVLAMAFSYIDLNYRGYLLVNSVLDIRRLSSVFIVCFSMMLILFIHISAYNRAIAQVSESAVTDQLTRIGNRFAFIEDLNRMEKGFREEDRDFSLVFIDINDFKDINDTHGHAVGDMVLREFAAAIGKHVRDTDRFYRTGGDEFILLFHGMTFNEARHRMGEICQKLKFEKTLTFPVRFAYGISSKSRSAEKSSGLLEHADKMMYKAKINYKSIKNLPDASSLFGIGCIGSVGEDESLTS